ncbi:hypothetical protein [Hymenobacter cellulosilyticus]|uniref:Uncharacterized protein n=1 Tax=Hymenobacter cellulosilyticus TaxID=2932248 RepID=A0A8T9Q6R0_9BACT|nr:hypothetical protein [Hymenobacter cellulosilyticus]UOQ73257.1 hypothetical protein MUN79_04615 [Hymenobacter cellulosilyticus]
MFSAVLLPSVKLVSALAVCVAVSMGLEPNGSAQASRTQTEPPTSPKRRTVARPGAAKTTCVTTNDTLAGQPFGTEPTVGQLLQAGARVISRKSFANVHEKGQTDTILTLQHQGNQFEFYCMPEQRLLRRAVIINFTPAYGQRLRQTLDASTRQNGGSCAKVQIRDTERTNNVSATFSAGKPSVAHVEPYLD